ncbi:MAG: hypothetical protein DLM69_09920 [Candidatus Chloroheliales bacterium]|nr:MAG: hypothetical protein DLM69_09920 [Chloroflexota bacterium]
MNKFNRTVILGSIAAAILLVSLVVIAAAQIGGSSAAASQPQNAVTQAQNVAAQANATPGTSTSKPITDTNTYYNIYLQNLANNLGVSKDKLTQSMVQAAKDTITQAVKDGKLTQAQADSLNQRIDQMAQNGRYGFEGFGRGFGPMGKGGMMGGPGKGAPVIGQVMQQAIQAVATKLGITTSELMTDLKSGQTLADIAKSKNVSVADLKTAIINAIKPTLDTAVKNGTLTQAQEDSIIQRIQSADFTKKGFGFGFGPGGFGHRGFGGPGNSNPGNGNPGNGTNG